MADEDDVRASAGLDPRRPARIPGERATTLILPEPGGFQLRQVELAPGRPARSEPDRPDGTESAAPPSIEDYAGRRRQDSSHRFGPLRGGAAPEPELPASATMEAHLAFWGEAEGRYRLARQDSAGRADAPGLAEACRDGHAATAHGLLLAYASRACLENPTPESRQTVIDLTPPALWSRADREPVLAAPSDELPGVILQHLGRYENEVRPWLEALPAIECSLDERIPGRCDAPETPPTPALANDNNAPARDAPDPSPHAAGAIAREEAPSLEDAGPEAGESEAPRHWRAMAMEAARELHREQALAERSRQEEPAPTEREQQENIREQTDARRERQAHRLEAVAREAAREITHARPRVRDEEGGREL